jgi:hypothetical protein
MRFYSKKFLLFIMFYSWYFYPMNSNFIQNNDVYVLEKKLCVEYQQIIALVDDVLKNRKEMQRSFFKFLYELKELHNHIYWYIDSIIMNRYYIQLFSQRRDDDSSSQNVFDDYCV